MSRAVSIEVEPASPGAFVACVNPANDYGPLYVTAEYVTPDAALDEAKAWADFHRYTVSEVVA